MKITPMIDLLYVIFVVPWRLLKYLTSSFSVHHNLSSAPHMIFIAFDIMCGVASIVNLTVISVERLFAVIRPAMHRNLSHPSHLTGGAVASVWLFAIVNSGLYFVKAFHNWLSYNIYIVVLGFVAPALIIVCSYIIIYKVAQQHVTEQRRIQQEMRLAGMIAIVIALFVACWFPFFLLNILYAYCQAPMCDRVIMSKSIPLVKFLHYSNSMMNPIVYAYRNSDYRKSFKNLLDALFRKLRYRRPRTVSATSNATNRSDVDENTLLDLSTTIRNN